MSAERILQALSEHGSPVAQACANATRANAVTPNFPPIGTMGVREASVLYEHRGKTMLAAGIRSEGLAALLEELARRAADEALSVASFSGEHESFVAFLDPQGAVVGCLRIEEANERPA